MLLVVLIVFVVLLFAGVIFWYLQSSTKTDPEDPAPTDPEDQCYHGFEDLGSSMNVDVDPTDALDTSDLELVLDTSELDQEGQAILKNECAQLCASDDDCQHAFLRHINTESGFSCAAIGCPPPPTKFKYICELYHVLPFQQGATSPQLLSTDLNFLLSRNELCHSI